MKLSIVIPANGSQSDIDDTLVSVLENRPADCEILFVHPESYVDPYQLDDEVRMLTSTAADLLSLLNLGFHAAQGKILHTICPGTTVPFGWCEPAMDAFDEDANLGSLAPTLLVGRKRLPIRGVGYHVGSGKEIIRKRGQRVLAPIVESGFYLRTAMQFMAGFDPQFAGFADVELGLRMYSANYHAIACSDVCLNSRLNSSHQRMQGYRAGQIRGRLFRKARAMGLDTSQHVALLTEPFRNGFGLGAITGVIGRLACGSTDRVKALAMDEVNDASSLRRAA